MSKRRADGGVALRGAPRRRGLPRPASVAARSRTSRPPCRCRRPSRAPASGSWERSGPALVGRGVALEVGVLVRTGRARAPARPYAAAATGLVGASAAVVASQNVSRSSPRREHDEVPALAEAGARGPDGVRDEVPHARSRGTATVGVEPADHASAPQDGHRRHDPWARVLTRPSGRDGAWWRRCGDMDHEPVRPAGGTPCEWEADVVLRDGTVAHVRPIRPDDADGIRRFHSRAVRRVDLPALLRAAASAQRPRRAPVHPRRLRRPGRARRHGARGDHRRRALRPDRRPQRPRSPSTSPTTTRARASARSCSSTWRRSRRSVGISRFTAEVLPQNRKMLAVFSDAGYEVTHHFEDGVIEVVLRHRADRAVQGRRAVARAPRRGPQHAHACSTRRRSRSSVRAGARRSIGSQLLAGILDAGFTGRLHPVNPEARRGPAALAAYPSRQRRRPSRSTSRSSPCPADAVLEVVDECAASGREGAARRVVRVRRGRARRAPGSRTSCVRRARGARACASSAPTPSGSSTPTPRCGSTPRSPRSLPPRGRLGLFAQSGRARHRGARLGRPPRPRHLDRSPRPATGSTSPATTSCSTGSTTTDTDAVGLYLESIGNPRKFSRIARQLALRQARHRREVRVSRASACRPGTGSGAPTCPARRRSTAMLAPGRRHPGRERPPALRRRAARHPPAAARGRPRRHRRQLRRARRAHRRAPALSWGLKVTHGPVSLPRRGDGRASSRRPSTPRSPTRRSTASLACFIPPLVTGDEDVAAAVRDAAAGRGQDLSSATFLGMRGVDDGLATASGDRRRDPRGPRLRDARGRRPRPGRRHPVRPVAGARPGPPVVAGGHRPRARPRTLVERGPRGRPRGPGA